MRVIKLFFVIGALSLCLASTESAPNHIKRKNFEGYIFPKEYIMEMHFEEMKGRFTPTNQNIIDVESIVKEQLGTINRSRPNQIDGSPIIHKELKKYRRQYVGFLDNNGDSIVWINFIWRKQISETWNKDVIIVLDGSSYYWNLKVNLNKKKIFDLQVNGPS